MEAYQERVIREEVALAEKITSLSNFLSTDLYTTLPDDEKHRLSQQLGHMQRYDNVLKQRIGAFKER